MKLRDACAAAAFAFAAAWPLAAAAHCDTLDGPVVAAARRALDTGDISYALVWVKKAGEAELRQVFAQAVAVRKAGGQARQLADMYFYETLVRIHRAGEGAPYTGLKAAGEVEPPIAAADRALRDGKLDPVTELVTGRVRDGLRRHFEQVMAKRRYDPKDVEGGRAYANAYVEYVHYVERLYNAADTLAPDAPSGHQH